MFYFDFCETTKKTKKLIFLFFHKNQNKSLQKPIFWILFDHTDVFFDQESEADVIFSKNWTPKGSKSCFFIESHFLKIDFPTKNRFFTP